MTPAQHIAAAEILADRVSDLRTEWSEQERIALALAAVAHTGIAIAIELGAPHQSGDTAAASSG